MPSYVSPVTGKFLLRKFHLGKFHQENSSYGKFLLWKIPRMENSSYGKLHLWKIPPTENSTYGKFPLRKIPPTENLIIRFFFLQNFSMPKNNVAGNSGRPIKMKILSCEKVEKLFFAYVLEHFFQNIALLLGQKKICWRLLERRGRGGGQHVAL